MTSLYIKGNLLHKQFKTTSKSSYYIYQFLVQNNDGIHSVINVHSQSNLNIEIDKPVDLPISVFLFDNQIIYEFKKV